MLDSKYPETYTSFHKKKKKKKKTEWNSIIKTTKKVK